MRHLILASLVLAVGCAKKPEVKQETTTPTGSNTPVATAPTASNTPSNTCNADTDCGDKQLCIRNKCVDITSDVAECNELKVYFAFDSSAIAPDDRPYLERAARCLKADHALHVRIEGNADERGTEEYNMALGDKRATTVGKYLQDLGVNGAQLRTVSYGKEQPLCSEHDEACWSKNRRAQLKMSEKASR